MYDAIVLAGGRARRLGGADKPALAVGSGTLLDRALTAVFGAARVVVVGPRRVIGSADVDWCLEDPAGGGPVAALATGVARTSAGVVVVLAADLPWIAPAVPVLLAALEEPGAGVAALVDGSGRVNHLAAAWRRAVLVDALAGVRPLAGAAMRSLLAHLDVLQVPDPAGWGRDCDTWDDVATARRELS